MMRIKSGYDEFRFDEKNRAIAEHLAATLPRLRQLGQQVTGRYGSVLIRVIITDKPPRLRDYLRLGGSLSFILALLTCLALLCLGTLVFVPSSRDAGGVFLWLVIFLTSFLWIIALVNTWDYRARWLSANALIFPLDKFAQRGTILLRWPALPRNKYLESLITLPKDELAAATASLAHMYAHCLVETHYRYPSLWRTWFREGFADLFVSWALGHSIWTTKSRDCVEEPEIQQNGCRLLKSQSLKTARLAARYYWEVRTLVEQGKLQEALSANRKQHATLRPVLQVERTPEQLATEAEQPFQYADMAKLTRLEVVPDAIFYQSDFQTEAQQLATALPGIRTRAKELTGSNGPGSVWTTLSSNAPPLWFVKKAVVGVKQGRIPLAPLLVFLAIRVLLPSFLLLLFWHPPFPLHFLAPIFFAAIAWLGLRRYLRLSADRQWQATWPIWPLFLHAGEQRSLIIIHWPKPNPRHETEALTYSLPDDVTLKRFIAGAYMQCLLAALKRKDSFPAWFTSGTASWFAETYIGQPYWRPESRRLAEGPEPPGADELLLDVRSEFSVPLLARYYWQVRTLVEQGKLPEALQASNEELEQLQPQFPEEQPIEESPSAPPAEPAPTLPQVGAPPLTASPPLTPAPPTFVSTAVLPAELHGWNWGAFFLSWIWAFSHNLPVWGVIGLALWVPCLCPVIGPLAFSIYLGVQGNTLAWRARPFASLEEFKRTQRIWAWWGIGTFLGLVFLVLLPYLAFSPPEFMPSRATPTATLLQNDHWQPVRVSEGIIGKPPPEEYHEIEFTDATHGWLLAWTDPDIGPLSVYGYNNSTLLHTTDGGKSWQEVFTFPATLGVSFDFVNPNVGWLCYPKDEQYVTERTLDGGRTWLASNARTEAPKQISAVSATEAWGITVNQGLVYTKDGGATWHAVRLPKDVIGVSLITLHFKDMQHGWIVTEHTEFPLLRTKDGGKSFQASPVRNTFNFDLLSADDVSSKRMHFVNEEEGWFACGKTILHTTDGGESWNEFDDDLVGLHTFADFSFPNRKQGWIVGEGMEPVIMHTNNGGESWESDEIWGDRLSGSLTRVYFVDQQHGWIIGNTTEPQVLFKPYKKRMINVVLKYVP